MVALLVSACDTGTPATPITATPPQSNSNPPPQNPAPTSQPNKKVNQVGIILNDDGILPNNLSVPIGMTRFVVTNKGSGAHDLVISNDSGVIGRTPVFSKADSPKTIEVTLQAGTYELASDAPGDAGKGLTGTVTAR
jgi:hypothetical protein